MASYSSIRLCIVTGLGAAVCVIAVRIGGSIATGSNKRKVMQNQAIKFTDKRSRAQTAAYYADRLHGADERNKANLGRWNSHLRDAWELEQIEALNRTGHEGDADGND
jgi:hypothetical protein